MRRETRKHYDAYLSQVAKVNDVSVQSLSSPVEVEPSVEQRLEENIQQSASFLKLINIESVHQQEGESVGLGIGEPIASTTDTGSNDRQPTDPTSLNKVRYRCEQTNHDTALKYSKLDRWAKFKDFQIKVRNAILKRQALDRIMIGFNGIKRESTSNRVTNPLLQDVNKGWLQKMREDAKERVMSEILKEDGTVEFNYVPVGKGKTYKNLDALVMDAVDNLIAPEFRDDDQLVAICGRKIVADKYFNLVNKDQDNSEILAADVIMSKEQIGGLPAMRATYFPDNAIFITRLDNLSIYWQEGTRRRHIIDNPKRDQIENYESVNECYVIEEYGCGALIENIKIEDEVAECPVQQAATL